MCRGNKEMNKTFDDYKNEVELINNEWNLSIKEVAKLKEEYLELDKQCAIERETANGLDYTCENYEKQIIKLKEEIEVWKNNFDNAFEVMQGFKSILDEIKTLAEGEYRGDGLDLNNELKEILAKHEDVSN